MQGVLRVRVQGLFSLFLSLLVLSGCSAKNSYPGSDAAPIETEATNSDGIIGGTKVASFDPIQASTAFLIDIRKGAGCTASVISARWLVTAAHCVQGAQPNDLLVGFVDSLDTLLKSSSTPRRRFVDSFVVNPKYSDTSILLDQLQKKATAEGRDIRPEEIDAIKDWGDIAVLHLSADVPSNVRPAKLLISSSLLRQGGIVTLAGYGQTGSDESAPSGVLMKVDVTIEAPVWGTTEVLMNQRSGKGACHGDSGGPAYVRLGRDLLLFGVTSRGVGDKDVQCVNSAAYTNIVAYRQWIRATTGI